MRNLLLYVTIAIWVAVLFVMVEMALLVSKVINVKEPAAEEFIILDSTIIVNNPVKSAVPEKTQYQKDFESICQICTVEYNKEIAYAVMEASHKYNIPKEIILAFIFTESGVNDINGCIWTGKLNKDAISYKDCYGLMQISKDALSEYNTKMGYDYTLEDMMDVSKCIAVGTWYAFSRFQNLYATWEEAYILYNAGPGNVKRYGYDYYKNRKSYEPIKRYRNIYNLVCANS